MKLFQLIVLTTLSIINSPLQALYPPFNIGEQIKQCVLSPDGKFLASTNYNLDTVNIWNIESRTLHGTFKKKNCFLFFSSDNTILFALSFKKIKSLIITPEGISKRATLKIENVNLDSGVIKYYTCESETCFTKLETIQNEFLISKFFSNGSQQSKKLGQDKTGFYIHSLDACIMPPDACQAALACTKGAYGYPYIHVVDLITSQTTHNYRLQCHISSISFSPDKTKLIFNAKNNNETWFVIIDLTTNTSFWFKQEKNIEYVAFINDKTILWVLRDGTVSSFELTEENLSNNCLPSPEIFKVVERAQDCH